MKHQPSAQFVSSTDAAIVAAIRSGTLSIMRCWGRLGEYWAIQDHKGLIEVALTAEEAEARVREVRGAQFKGVAL